MFIITDYVLRIIESIIIIIIIMECSFDIIGLIPDKR